MHSALSCMVSCSYLSVPTQRALCFALLWSCKPLVCNFLARVAELMTGGHLRAAGCSHTHCHSWFSIGSWNLHSLVESEGSVAIASTRRGVHVDRKVNLLVEELRRFEISITGISETKWFGQDVYEVDGFVLVHSGRPIPADEEPVQRNAGVGILLNPTMAAAWRDSGECWRAVSFRIVSVHIQLQRCTSCGVKRQNGTIYLTVIISVYAPTFRSPQEHKGQFYDDLMCTINLLCLDDLILVVGDVSARVGSNHLDLVKGE